MLDAYAAGQDGQACLALLSTYLGHIAPAHTYWYYSDSRVIPTPAPSHA
jgi:integrase/recombinase XerD